MALRYSVIIPAYNEEKALGRAVRETAAVFDPLKEEYEIVVVNDGSTDATASVAGSLSDACPFLKIHHHETNRGKGEAVRTGVAQAAGEYLLFLDADLATHPSEALNFMKAIRDADIVIGSRQAAGAVIAVRQPWYRILAGKFINFFVRAYLKLNHRDTQCGFKMFRAEAAKRIFSEIGSSRWVFDVEVLLRAEAAGYRVAELPVTWTNGARTRVKIGEVLADLRYLLRLKKQLDKIDNES